MFFAVTLINKKFEQKSIFNVLTFKENISKLITNPDNVYINKDYQALVSYYKTISKSDSCVMIFTNEVAIPYLLKKKTCSKYYLMYTATPKEIQNNIIAVLKNEKPKFLIYKSDIDIYGHAGDRLLLLDEFIQNQYSFFKKFSYWEIYKLK